MKRLHVLLVIGLMAGMLFSAVSAKELKDASDIGGEIVSLLAGSGSFADKCCSDYGYRDLGKNTEYDLATLYERIDEAVKAFDKDGTFAGFSDESIFEIVDISDLKLGSNDTFTTNLQIVYNVYRLDHPLFFWLNPVFSFNYTTMALRCDEDYHEASARLAAYEKIKAETEDYFEYAKDCEDTYSKVTAITYLMAQKNDYAFDENHYPSLLNSDHNIIGILADDHTAVCEGYSKSLQLMLNYLGIPNVLVYGEAKADGSTSWERHAWNMIMMDNGRYYYFDPTWSDFDVRGVFDTELEELPYRVTYRFHAKGSSFTSSHRAFDSSLDSADYLYALPEAASSDYIPAVSGVLPRETFNAGASYYTENYISNGDYSFVVMQNDGVHRQAEIVGLSNALAKETSIIIPSEISYQGVVYKVCGVDMGIANYNVRDLTFSEGITYMSGNVANIAAPLENVNLPSSLGFIMYNGFATMNLKKISVSSENPYYTEADGVLYSKDMKQLIAYPAGKDDKSFTVPETVAIVDPMAFMWNTALAEINIPGNANLYFENGAVYDRESNKLIKYLAGGNETRASIPKKCGNIADYAFFGTGFDDIVIYNKDMELNDEGSNMPDFYKLSSVISSKKVNIYAYSGSTAQAFADYYEDDIFVFKDIAGLVPEEHLLTINEDTKELLENKDAGIVLWGLEDGESYFGEVSFTVSCEQACMVLIMKDGAKSYTRLKAGAGEEENTYIFSFEADADFEIAIVKAGDFNLDGRVDSADALQILRYDVGKLTDVKILQLIAGNVSGNDSLINSADALQVLRYDVGKTSFAW